MCINKIVKENVVDAACSPAAQIIISVITICFLFYVQMVVSEFSGRYFTESTAVFGGLFAGGLHALSGPDHLAAILPLILGKGLMNSAFFGCTWGCGHGLSSALLATLGFFLKDSFIRKQIIPQLTTLADYAVGITLIIIGIMGVLELQHIVVDEMTTHAVPVPMATVEMENDSEQFSQKSVHENEKISLYAENVTNVTSYQGYEVAQQQNGSCNGRQMAIAVTTFANGFLLGLSWDGLPSLAPTLTLQTWQTLLCFVIAYFMGTVLTIGSASVAIAASTKWLSNVTSVDLPKRLSMTSSLCAICIGFLWVLQSLLLLFDVPEDEGDLHDGVFSVSRCLFGVVVCGSPLAIVGWVLLRMMKNGHVILSSMNNGWRTLLNNLHATRMGKYFPVANNHRCDDLISVPSTFDNSLMMMENHTNPIVSTNTINTAVTSTYINTSVVSPNLTQRRLLAPGLYTV